MCNRRELDLSRFAHAHRGAYNRQRAFDRPTLRPDQNGNRREPRFCLFHGETVAAFPGGFQITEQTGGRTDRIEICLDRSLIPRDCKLWIGDVTREGAYTAPEMNQSQPVTVQA